MAKIIKNKLIRDLMPKYIEKNGQIAKITTLNNDDFIRELVKKLTEEVREVSEATTEGRTRLTEEISDLYEVVDEIMKFYKIEKSEVLTTQKDKNKTNGGFKKKLFLVSVEE